jgi:hypothetical protein
MDVHNLAPAPKLAARTLRHFLASQGPTILSRRCARIVYRYHVNSMVGTQTVPRVVSRGLCHAMQLALRQDSPRFAGFVVSRTLCGSRLCRIHLRRELCYAMRGQVKPRRSSHAVPCESCRVSPRSGSASLVALCHAMLGPTVRVVSRQVVKQESRHPVVPRGVSCHAIPSRTVSREHAVPCRVSRVVPRGSCRAQPSLRE